MENYYTDKTQVTSSGIKEVLKSPAHYKLFLDRDVSISTDAMKFGNLVHTTVLEPEKLDKFEISVHGGSQEGKEQIEREKQGLITRVSESAIQKAGEIRDAIKDKAATWLEPKGSVEHTIQWEHDTLGACKGKIDKYIAARSNADKHIIFDLKTCEKAYGDNPQLSAYNYKYYIQAYWYITGLAKVLNVPLSRIEFIFFFVEKSKPYASRIFVSNIGDAFVKYGKEEVFKAEGKIIKCRSEKNYPDYGDERNKMTLPYWVKSI